MGIKKGEKRNWVAGKPATGLKRDKVLYIRCTEGEKEEIKKATKGAVLIDFILELIKK